jgi:hypothetical protein
MKFVYKFSYTNRLLFSLTKLQMELLLTDVILFLSNNYLEKNKDKLSFLSCVTSWHTLKSKVHFQREILYNQRLESLFYYKNLNIRYVMPHNNNFKSIPKYTKTLYLNRYFNRPLKKGDIPNSVTTLVFNYRFNHPLEKEDIPNFVTTLKFRYRFNQPLKKGDIPNSVTTLQFGSRFNQPLSSDNIPNTVKEIVLNKAYTLPIPDSFLNRVTYI